MPIPAGLPDGTGHVRTTPEFDERTVPAGLLSSHRIADGVWGRLVVRSGSLRFVVEDAGGGARLVAAGEAQVIPPAVPHHVELVGPVRFAVEFHR
jgi:tellurite resistance-related uncharacterized protein